MSLQLVPYDLSDVKEATKLHGIISEYYTRSPWPPTVERIMQGSVKYFKVLDGQTQVGITGYALKTPTLAETIKTTVFQEHRGKGLGTKISLAIEEECRRIGVKKVISTIYFFNHAMISIKLKQGYTIEGYHPNHEAPGYHEYSLGKVLV